MAIMEVTNATWKPRVTHPLGRLVKDLVAAKGADVLMAAQERPERGREVQPSLPLKRSLQQTSHARSGS